MSSGSTDGAHSRKTVEGGGSSTTLSRALAAPSVSRSASSITTICHRPVLGPPRRRLHDGAHLVDTDRQPLGHDASDIGVGAGHRRRTGAALTAAGQPRRTCTAARPRNTARPPTARSPGGPVISHACVMVPVKQPHCESSHRARPGRGRPTRPPRRAGPPIARKPRTSPATVVVCADATGPADLQRQVRIGRADRYG